MKTNYFINCTTLDEAKNLFKELCKKLHPDTSGYNSQQDFIDMFNEFKSFKPKKESKNDAEFDASEFYDLLKNFDVLTDIKINFVGSFIWLEDISYGATYRQKETIKNIKLINFKNANFASTKKAWFFAPNDYKKKTNKRFELDELKNKYGCKSFNTKNVLSLK